MFFYRHSDENMLQYTSMQNQKIPWLFFLLILGILIPRAHIQAALFNPENIITDTDLQDWESMDRSGIRAFLRNKNSSLSDMIIEDFEGKRRYASEIIYQSARNYQINPKYLLVKLQKEQSLVTSQNPTQRQLDWATGYGACDSCDTTDPRLEKYKGFGKQVDNAAGIMRWYYENAGREQWIKKPNTSYTIDTTIITPANQATAFLYTYTPHLQGNQNFWKLWQNWFQQRYPNGTLIKSNTSSTVYVIHDGQKKPIKSMTVLTSRFNPQLLVTVPADEIDRYELGRSIIFPNYSILNVDNEYFLLDHETARPFSNIEVVRNLGYHPDEIITANNDDLSAYQIGEPITLENLFPLGYLVRLIGTDQLYYLKNNDYWSLSTLEIAKSRRIPLAITNISAEKLNTYNNQGPLLMPDGSLIGSKLTGRIYVVEKGKKRAIDSEKTFLSLGYSFKNTLWLDDFLLDQYQTGEPIYVLDSNTLENPIVSSTSTSGKISLQLVKQNTNNTTTLPTFKKDLAPGTKGTDVRTLQTKLRALGYLNSSIKINGVYGPATTAAIKKFQVEQKIQPNGKFTATTRSAFNQMLSKSKQTTQKTIDTVSTIKKTNHFINPLPEGPYPFEEIGKMYSTPTTTLTFLGDQNFNTPIDTYLIAEYADQIGLGSILAGKNIDTPRPMASFTKVMTGYKLINNNVNLDASVTYNPNLHKARYGYLYPIAPGDMVANRDLLYSLLVSSFNTPALMLIDSMNMKESDFVAEMNLQAKAWNLNHTYFFDSSGVDVRNQSTARDYSILFSQALRESTLYHYLGTSEYEYTELTNVSGATWHRDLHTNRLMQRTDLPYTILASKTGYLNESGFGITMLIERTTDQKKFLVITMGNPNYATKYSETDRLATWAIQKF